MAKVKVVCANCGTVVERWPSRLREGQNTYCSPGCQWAGRRERVMVECANCGTEFERVPSQVKDDNYCSPECAYEARKLNLGEPPLCACGCGEQVTSTRSGEWCEYIHGHSFRGRIHTEESRQKMREAKLEIADKIAERVSGAGNPMWRGGNRETTYHQERQQAGWNWWHAMKMRERLIAERGHQCEYCGNTDCRLELHHIDHNLANNQLSNFQLLCRSCHMKATAEFAARERSS